MEITREYLDNNNWEKVWFTKNGNPSFKKGDHFIILHSDHVEIVKENNKNVMVSTVEELLDETK